MLLGGDATAIIGDRHRFIRVNHHINLAAVPRQGLIDTVIHELKHHVV